MAAQLVLRSFSEGGRVTTENAPFADRNKNFLPFLKTFEIASINISRNSFKCKLIFCIFQKKAIAEQIKNIILYCPAENVIKATGIGSDIQVVSFPL